MILVTLGTQDKEFLRIVEKIDELKKSNKIKDKVVVQLGHTKYKSDSLELFDFVSKDELDKLIDSSRLVITHGGVGSILTALEKNKKVIAIPRLSKYKEHTNDHQLEIVEKFNDLKYIIGINEVDNLEKKIKEIDNFKPKKYNSNNNKFIKIIENYIDKDDSMSLFKKYKEVIMYIIFGVLTTVINILSFQLLTDIFKINNYISNVIAWVLSIVFAFVTNKIFVFESKNNDIKSIMNESLSFLGCRIFSLLFDMITMYLMLDIFKISKLTSKIVANVIVVIMNYVLSKVFVFKK